MKFQKREVKSSDSGGSDKYLKFKDGESKSVILRGEIYEFKNKWVNGKGVICDANDPEGKSRFRINAVTLEGGQLTVKIWELPLTVYNQLADINSEYPLEKTKLKVTRQGTGTDTVYHILPLLSEKDQITLNIQGALAKLDLHILDNKAKAHAPPNGWDGEPMPSADDSLPF